MVKKNIIFSFTKSDDIIFLFVISCNLFARESLLSNMILHGILLKILSSYITHFLFYNICYVLF